MADKDIGRNAGGCLSISSDIYFHRQLQHKTSVAQAALLLTESAQALGWDLVAFHQDIRQADLPRGRDGEFIGTSMGWRAETVNTWVQSGLAHNCPIGHRCELTPEPFLWDCDVTRAEWCRGRLSVEEHAVLQHYKRDVCGGVTVPVWHAGKTGYVSWCSRKRERLERGYDASLSSIHLLSHTFMRQLDRIQTSGDRRVLTVRETECLTWAARGKTSEEIARVLQRSAETVEFHLANAMLKLGARNRTHAVAIATQRGLLAEVGD